MGLRWHIPLPGPFSLSGNVFPRRRRRPTTYWTHPGCTIRHQREDTANRCPNGRRRNQ